MIFTTRNRTAVLAAGGALAALLAAGCAHNDEPPAQVNTTTVTPPAAAPAMNTTTTTPGGASSTTTTNATPSTNNTNAGAGGATGTETATADAVNKAIHNNAQMTGSRVTAVVNASGAARLTGTAQNQQQKALAESTARQAAGVSSVINKIEIVPTGGMKAAAAKPAPAKTKIIVVHDKAPMSAAPATDQSMPKGSMNGGTGSTPPAPTPAGGTGSGTDGTATPPASSTGTTSQ